MGKSKLRDVDGDVVVGSPLKELTNELDVFFVSFGKFDDVFNNTTTGWEIVKHVRDATAVVIPGVADTEGKAKVLITAERGRKSGESSRFSIEFHLMISLQRVDDREIFHPRRNSSYRLERGVSVKEWPNNTFVEVSKIDAKVDTAVLFRNKDDRMNPFSGLDDFADDLLSFQLVQLVA